MTRRAIHNFVPEAVVHDILTLAPALTAVRLPRTPCGRALWRALAPRVARGAERGRHELSETRVRLGLAPLRRVHGGISSRLAIIGTFPQLEYPRAWPGNVHVVGPLLWALPRHSAAPR